MGGQGRREPEVYRRKSIRLPAYDYAQTGAYFVTIVSDRRRGLFGEIRDGEFGANEQGRIVSDCWESVPLHFPGIELDAFVLMPNHLHGILWIRPHDDRRGAACRAPTRAPRVFGPPDRGSLSTVKV